ARRPRGGSDGRRRLVAHLRLDHAAAAAALHRARGAAGDHLRGQHVRPDLHHDGRRAGHRERQPALLHLPTRLPRLRHRSGRGDGRRRRHRHHHRGDAGTAPHLPQLRREGVTMSAQTYTGPRRRGVGVALTTVTWLLALAFFFPVLWLAMTAFKQENQASSSPPTWVFTPTLDQFRAVIEGGSAVYVGNSAIATGVSTLLVLLLGIPASYALSIRPVKRVSDVLFFFISTKMLPVVAVIVPIYVIAGQLRVLDNIWTLVVLYTAMNLPIAVWMMRSFFQEIPVEVLEAASMDGAGLMRTLRSVLLPMVAPGIAATALICVIFAWNEFFFALNLTASRAATVPLFITSTMTSEGLFLARLSAAAILASLPVILAGWIAQKQLVRGLSMGAIK